MRKTLFNICVLLALSSAWTRAYAQVVLKNDTIEDVRILPGVTKVQAKYEKLRISKLETDVSGVRSVVSPLGEGDPVKWVQNLPGVTTGADGTTAFYVRGSNVGNNLFSLDGVPVYGYSHLLGMTTIVPQSVMQEASLTKSGFEGKDNNFTAAHLNVTTKAAEDEMRHSVSLNTFLLGVGSEGKISNNLSYIISARISPLTWEYRAIRGSLPSLLGDLEDFGATVGDLYAKLHWKTGENSWIEVSGMGSVDNYAFSREIDSDESMGWQNGIGLLRWHWNGDRTVANLSASYNYYHSQQKQDKIFRGQENHLSLESGLKEATIDYDATTNVSDRVSLGYGLKTRYASFNPGQVGSFSNQSDVMLTDAFLQAGYSIPERLDLKAFARLNYYTNSKDKSRSFDPEAGLSVRWHFNRHIALEGSVDRLVQYYHTLEGLPVGWALDMIVPTLKNVAPETSLQSGVNLELDFGHHHASLGGYYKSLDNLVYYKQAQNLFSGGMANWQNEVSQGEGTSYGCELLYTYEHDDLYARASYTWSKTDRSGFDGVNEGKSFHARFDRRHVMNLTAQWKGVSAAFTLQSGHWENGAPVSYQMSILDGETWEALYYSGINNYHMPMVMRLDLGYQHTFKTGRAEHELNLGICNVTNHFNPFMIYYDAKAESWTQIALLPIMPTFSYKVCF